METRKQAVTADLKLQLMGKKQDIYIQERGMELAADE